MIVYFADRSMNITGQATTYLPEGLRIENDEKVEDVETGVSSFSCDISYDEATRSDIEKMVEAGNYILRYSKGLNEFYTIIESEVDDGKRVISLYAEDAGLDLINDVAEAYEATEAHTIEWYANMWIADAGFTIGTNEISNLTRTLKWDSEATVTERLNSLATEFDNAELNFSFEVDKMTVVKKYLNIFKKRGKDVGVVLRKNQDFKDLVITKSVSNLATALKSTGGTPEGSEEKITLQGVTYDDGDFHVSDGLLKSRKALEKWSRYSWEKKTSNYDGHIVKTFTYDTVDKQELLNRSLTKLKEICDVEVNYEITVDQLPDNVGVGDTVVLADEEGKLFLSARILKLQTSEVDQKQKATIGEYLIKSGGISEKVEYLASEFAKLSESRTLYTWIVYADDETGAGISLDATGKKYIGICSNRLKLEPDITDPSIYQWSLIEGKDGKDGTDGKSVVRMVEYYLVSSQSTGITIETSGWVTSPIPVMDSVNKYLWNYEVLEYTDGSSQTLTPKIIGVYGDEGTEPPRIIKMERQYYMSTSNTEQKGGSWSPTLPEWSDGLYLWTRWGTYWSEANPTPITYSEPVLSTDFNDIHQTAKDADAKATEAKTNAEAAKTQVTQVNQELMNVNAEVDALTQNLETLENTMTTDYAKKQELTDVQTNLSSQIAQNAASISSTVTRVDQIDIDVSAAQEAADAAQSAADQAAEKAADAQTKYTALKNQADTTDEELEAAKTALEKAQADATAAGDAAAAAKSLADSLESRTTTNETAIKQNSDSISLVAETASAAVSSLESAKSEWEVNFESISGRVESTEKWQDDKNELITKMQEVTELLIENGKFKFNFNQMMTDVEENKEEIQKQTKYVQIVEDASEGATIIIGDSESGMVAQFTKTALTFKNGDTVLATYANDGLTVENITTKNQLLFEGHGWAIRPGKEVTSGKFNLNDVWIGG